MLDRLIHPAVLGEDVGQPYSGVGVAGGGQGAPGRFGRGGLGGCVAGHARPETTMRYDRRRKTYSDHGAYVLAQRFGDRNDGAGWAR